MERECKPVATGTDATAFNFNDDAAFEELDTSELGKDANEMGCPISLWPEFMLEILLYQLW